MKYFLYVTLDNRVMTGLQKQSPYEILELGT